MRCWGRARGDVRGVRAREREGAGAEAGEPDVRGSGGGGRPPGSRRCTACGTRGQGGAGAEVLVDRRVGRRGHVRGANRQGVRRGGDGRVRTRNVELVRCARRGRGHRLHARGLHPGGKKRYDVIFDNVENRSLGGVEAGAGRQAGRWC